MCARFYRYKDLKNLYIRFKIAEVLSVLEPQYNIAPTDKALVIPSTSGPRKAVLMPFAIKNPWIHKGLLLNMRAESFVNKPGFRKYLNQRCLVIADGFIEWEHKGTGKNSQTIPYRVDPTDGEPIGLAGVYTDEGFVIITTEPNKVVGKFHDRMPVILRREDEDVWLDPNVQEFSKLIPMLAPYPSEALLAHKISPSANSSKNKEKTVLNKL